MTDRICDVSFLDLLINAREGTLFFDGVPGIEGVAAPPPSLSEPIRTLIQMLVGNQDNERALRNFAFEDVRYRVTKLPTLHGLYFLCRRIMMDVSPLTQLGMPEKVARRLINMGQPGNAGLVVVIGPIGGGKTTTTYSLLAEMLTKFGGRGQTYERDIEIDIQRIHGTQGGFCLQTPVSEPFAAMVPTIMRNGARYQFIDEVLDPIRAGSLLDLGNAGHLVLTTCHGKSLVDGLTRLAGFGRSAKGEQAWDFLAQSLQAALYQTIRTDRSGATTLSTEFLFLDDDNEGQARSMIRDGNLPALQTIVASQFETMYPSAAYETVG